MSAVLCLVVKCCFYLALYLRVGERNSNVSSIFQALHLLGLLLASAGPCRWLHSPATLINNCCPTWRVGLQSDSRIISLQAAAVPCWKWVCGDSTPRMAMSGPPHGSMYNTVLVSSPAIQKGGTNYKGYSRASRIQVLTMA